jgi:hypothetical protein
MMMIALLHPRTTSTPTVTRVLVPRTRNLPPPEAPTCHYDALRQILQAEAEAELSSSVTLDGEFSPLDLTWVVSGIATAGYQPLTPEDVKRSEALNAGYLKRVSIKQSFSGLDRLGGDSVNPGLHDGRLLIYTRGYGKEELNGRLLLEKFDFLQSVLLQRTLAPLVSRFAKPARQADADNGAMAPRAASRKNRYANRFASTDTLAPFVVADNSTAAIPPGYAAVERVAIEDTLYSKYEAGLQHELQDDDQRGTSSARQSFAWRQLVSNSHLVEPTYRHLLVLWRPSRARSPPAWRSTRARQLPRLALRRARAATTQSVRRLATNLPFGVGRSLARALPPPLPLPPSPPSPPQPPLELRVFDDVPLANFGAVLPGNELAVSPAEALRLDVVSVSAKRRPSK